MLNGLEMFTLSINGLIESKLIMVDKQIENVLKSVAANPLLTKCLADTLKTTGYATEFSRAKVTFTNSKGVLETKLKLPQEQNKLFTFVVCLLTEFSRGKRSLFDFTKEFFGISDAKRGFEVFCENVLKPFKLAGESLLAEIDPNSVDDEAEQRANRYFSAEKLYLNSGVLRVLLSAIQTVREKLQGVSFPSKKAQDDAFEITDAMTNAVQSKNPVLLRICRIGFISNLLQYPSLKEDLALIVNLLEKNYII